MGEYVRGFVRDIVALEPWVVNMAIVGAVFGSALSLGRASGLPTNFWMDWVRVVFTTVILIIATRRFGPGGVHA